MTDEKKPPKVLIKFPLFLTIQLVDASGQHAGTKCFRIEKEQLEAYLRWDGQEIEEEAKKTMLLVGQAGTTGALKVLEMLRLGVRE